MKKLFVVIIAFTMVFAGCEKESDETTEVSTTLKINNLSDYPLISVEFSAVYFGTIGSGKDVTNEVNTGTKYIYFVLLTNTSGMIRCRTETVNCEGNKNNEIIILNNTIITITATEENDTLRNICKKYGVKSMLYDIGDTGPGGGIIFFAEGGQYAECSGELGKFDGDNAKWVANQHRGGGFINWRLPNEGELSLMYYNLHRKGLGGFYNSEYWSAKDITMNNGDIYRHYTNFNNGYQGRNLVSHSYRVRAVRSFSF